MYPAQFNVGLEIKRIFQEHAVRNIFVFRSNCRNINLFMGESCNLFENYWNGLVQLAALVHAYDVNGLVQLAALVHAYDVNDVRDNAYMK